MFSQETQEISSSLPALAVLTPALAALVIAIIASRNEKLRNFAALGGAVITSGIVVAIALRVFGGTGLYFETRLAGINGYTLKFQVDAMSALFALVASTLWVFAVAHANSYMTHEEKRTRFFAFLMICEAATLGVFLVADFFSLFIFFEIMGLAAYLLVVHSETEPARKAATKYIYMTVTGGLSLLMGIFLYFYFAGTLSFIPEAHSIYLESLKVAALIFLIAGFGVKAGIVPLHVWLPDAHPAAPSPASALLSGVMLKTGAYGILRAVTSFYYTPASHEVESAAQAAGHEVEKVAEAVIHTAETAVEAVTHGAETVASGGAGITMDLRTLGFAIIWLAIITMFTGMALAVLQRDIKRTLAYSSVSQMGFILLGAGCLVYLGGEGGIGLAGSLFHVINHALFKGALFLIAGSILFRTHELNMFNLGGLYRKMPVSTLFWCIAALGIMGIPLFNGFASKTILHHAIVEANHLAGESAPSQAFWLGMAEKIFVITAGGTVLYFLKMTYFTFFKSSHHEENQHHDEVKEAPFWMLAGSGALALGVVVIGFMPETILKSLIIPVLEIFPGFDIHAVEHLAELKILAWTNINDVFPPLVIGLTAFAAGIKFDLFNPEKKRRFLIPVWLSFDYWYIRGARAFVSFCFITRGLCHAGQCTLADGCQNGFGSLCLFTRNFNRKSQDIVRDTCKLSKNYANSLASCLSEFNKLTLKTGSLIPLSAEGIVKRINLALEPLSGDMALGALCIAILLAIVLYVAYL